MISVYNIKPKFQQLLKPILEKLYQWGVTANQITVVAIILSGILGFTLWNVQDFSLALIIVPLGLLVRMALNALDGMMARNYNMQSKTGEILNEFGDVISDTMIYFPLIKLNGVNPTVILGFVILGILNEFAGVLAKIISGTRRYDGPMGKSDRALLVGLVCLISYFWCPIQNYLSYIFAFAILLLIISTYTRLKRALK